MWKSSDGVAHAVALPDLRTAMSPEFVRSIESLSQADRALLVDAVDGFNEELELLLDDVVAREPRTPDETRFRTGTSKARSRRVPTW